MPAFLAAFVAGDVAFGQRLSDLPLYVFRQGEVAAGYGAAMYIAGDRVELLGFLAGMAALLAVAIAAVWTRGDRSRGAVAVGGLVIVLLLVFKAAFVRQDTHTQIGWSGARPHGPRHRDRARAPAFAFGGRPPWGRRRSASCGSWRR